MLRGHFLVTIVAAIISAIILVKMSKNDECWRSANEVLPVVGIVTERDGGSGDDAGAGGDLDWWKHTPIYQIYPRSFQDSNGDGVGDLIGIKQRIPYLYELGIKAVWLSPVYQSPMADFGYDISNYTNIDPLFGTLNDFQELVDEMHKHGIHLIMDFVPNHSSDQHPWFQKSVKGEEPYRDYYVWRDKPNNWLSYFGNSSWEYSESRNQYYLHHFLVHQPDQNYRSPKLRQEMIDVLHYWVDRGVDGFRVDAIALLVEDAQFRDDPKSGKDLPPNSYFFLQHPYNENLPETYQVVSNWTKFLGAYGHAHDKHIFMCTEMGGHDKYTMRYYQVGVDFPFNFNLMGSLNSDAKASSIRDVVRTWMEAMPAGAWPNWVMGSHDILRVASRLGGRQYIDVANMLLLLLPGTPTYYFGDEIGMINANVSYNETVDPFGKDWGPKAYMNFSRDPERAPMQWDSTRNAGFSTAGKTWLPLAEGWEIYNVERESKDPNSHLSIFKALVSLRQQPVFRQPTNLRLIDVGDESVFAFDREQGDIRYLVILNFGHNNNVSTIDQLALGTGEVVIRSANANLALGSIVDFNQPFLISSTQGYVLKLAG